MSSLHAAHRDRIHAGSAFAVLVDYDGTIATNDVTDDLIRAASSEKEWLALEQAYREGAIGSRALLEAETRLLPRDRADLPDILSQQPHDPTFASFVASAKTMGAIVEIVSDGLGFFVEPAIAALDVGAIEIYSANVEFASSGPTIRFPHGNPECLRCGTCKRSRVLTHQAAGRHVVFVGDGYSDQYAVAYADTVFAKGDLVGICRDRQIAFRPWSTFDDVESWLSGLGPDGLPGPTARPFVCGPEAWGIDATR
jgi:2-hydroxy-3-keto-5-methylthiopentenyl-1-phosphate phosphatase